MFTSCVALQEAGNNARVLSALQPWTQKLHDSEDFMKLSELFGPLPMMVLISIQAPYFATVGNFVILSKPSAMRLLDRYIFALLFCDVPSQ